MERSTFIRFVSSCLRNWPGRLVGLGVLLFGLTGCYTQLAVVERGVYTDREPDYVEVEDYGDSTVVSKYYYEDQYAGDYAGEYYDDAYYYDSPYRYQRHFTRFSLGAHLGPSCWDSYFYYDPFCYSYYDPFFLGSHYGYGYGYGYGYRPYYPSYVYVYAPYYAGYWYDAPYSVRRRDGMFEPRGATMGRGTLTAGLGGRGTRRDDGGRGSHIGRSGLLDFEGRRADTGRSVIRSGGSTVSPGSDLGRSGSSSRGVVRSGGRDAVGRSTGRGTVSSGSRSRGTYNRGTVTRGSRGRGTYTRGTETRGTETRGTETRSTETRGTETRGTETRGTETRGSTNRGTYERGRSRGERSTRPAPRQDSGRSHTPPPPPPRREVSPPPSSPPPSRGSVGRSTSRDSSGSRSSSSGSSRSGRRGGN